MIKPFVNNFYIISLIKLKFLYIIIQIFKFICRFQDVSNIVLQVPGDFKQKELYIHYSIRHTILVRSYIYLSKILYLS